MHGILAFRVWVARVLGGPCHGPVSCIELVFGFWAQGSEFKKLEIEFRV